jgi:CheY-like chemotaxis protein
MFSQVDVTSVRTEGGLGIGLALVKGLMELHGGSVEARSAGLGRGSEFTARLPLPSLEQPGMGNRSAGAAARQTARRRVLVADDNKGAADSLAMILKVAGHEVQVAHNGSVALSLARTFRPEVALLDIGMPDMSGYEVARSLRQEQWGKGIYIIALTGWGQESDRQQALDAGFDRHLTKSVDPGALDVFLAEEPG